MIIKLNDCGDVKYLVWSDFEEKIATLKEGESIYVNVATRMSKDTIVVDTIIMPNEEG